MNQPCRIVVLDALPLNPGDLDWAPLGQLGELTIHGGTSAAEAGQRLETAQAAFTNKVRIDAATLSGAPDLKFVGVLATGYDVVDVAAAAQRGIVVSNVPSYSAAFTAQTTIALLLELTHHCGAHDAAVHAGDWSRSGAFSFWNQPLVELAGKTLLIVGMGNIGSHVAAVGAALGMTVWAGDLPGRARGRGPYERRALDSALPLVDVVSLHCPLTNATRHLINVERLSLMRPGALLVNASRGPLVDEQAVAASLRAGHLGGYACDVLSQEPPPVDNPLLAAPRCIVTPHLGWASIESRRRLLDVSIANLRGFLQGHPQNRVA